MARPGLMRHRKFARLERLLGSAPLARGCLEMLWDVAYENGDDLLGDSADLEHLAGWSGEPGKLTSALVESGFIDREGEEYRVHDLLDHAPDYVRKRLKRETQRRETGAALRSMSATQKPLTGQRPDNDRSVSSTPAFAPAPAPAQKQLPCAEPDKPAAAPALPEQPDSSPVVVVMPVVGKGPKEYPVTEAKIREWQEAYPGVDVLREVKALAQWARDNPSKRKTYRGAPSFFGRNLARKQDQNPQPRRPDATDAHRAELLAAEAEAYRDTGAPAGDESDGSGLRGSPPLDPTADHVAADGPALSSPSRALGFHWRTAG